jgi:hypothetical protein
MRTAAPRATAVGFESTGIYPFNPVILLKTAFRTSSVSERPTYCNVNRSQDKPPGCNNQKLSTIPKEAALASSTSIEYCIRDIIPSPKTGHKRNAPRQFGDQRSL